MPENAPNIVTYVSPVSTELALALEAANRITLRNGGYDYLIYRAADTYYAIRYDGIIEFSGTDFTTVIQAAHDAIPENDGVPGNQSGSGGTILLSSYQPDATDFYFVVNSTIVITKNITIRALGNPKRLPVLQLGNGANCDMIQIGVDGGSSNHNIITIDGLRITGNKENQTEVCSGIVVKGTANEYVITDCEIRAFTGYSIYINNPRANQAWNTIAECWLLSSDLGQLCVDIPSGGTQVELYVRNCYFLSSVATIPGISYTGNAGSRSMYIIGCRFWTCGVVINQTARNFLIQGNIFSFTVAVRLCNQVHRECGQPHGQRDSGGQLLHRYDYGPCVD